MKINWRRKCHGVFFVPAYVAPLYKACPFKTGFFKTHCEIHEKHGHHADKFIAESFYERVV